MNIKLFQSVAAVLLQTHYGLELNDTPWSEERAVKVALEVGQRPYQAINDHAKDCDLDRTDITGAWGIPKKDPLTKDDELLALATASATMLVGEEIVHCPTCGSRTQFDDLEAGCQHHRCLNTSCGNEFITEPDEQLEEEGA